MLTIHAVVIIFPEETTMSLLVPLAGPAVSTRVGASAVRGSHRGH